MRSKLFVDFDDTAASTRDLVASFLQQHYGVTIPTDHAYNGDSLLHVVNQNRAYDEQIDETGFWLHYSEELLASHDWHKDVDATPGAHEIIPQLAQHYELWIVTARPTSSQAVVQAVLDRLFPDCFTGSHFVWHFDGTEFIGTPKHTFMELMGSGVAFVDDSPHEITRAAHIVESFLFDPHDHHASNQHIPNRVASWHDIADRFL